jgi:hypothetical protein
MTPLYPPCRFQPKYILESPKSPITQIHITQSFQSRFHILSMHTMALCLSYSTQFNSRLRRIRARSYKIVCTSGHPPPNAPAFRHSEFRHNYFASMILFKNNFTRAIVCGVTLALSMGLITTKLSAKYNGNCGPSL